MFLIILKNLKIEYRPLRQTLETILNGMVKSSGILGIIGFLYFMKSIIRSVLNNTVVKFDYVIGNQTIHVSGFKNANGIFNIGDAWVWTNY